MAKKPVDYVARKAQRDKAIERARHKAEAAVEEREALRLEIRTRDLIKEIDNIGNYDFAGDRVGILQARLHLEAKKTLLDRVLPVLKSVDMDSILQQAREQVSLVQVVRFDNGEGLAYLDPKGAAIDPHGSVLEHDGSQGTEEQSAPGEPDRDANGRILPPIVDEEAHASWLEDKRRREAYRAMVSPKVRALADKANEMIRNPPPANPELPVDVVDETTVVRTKKYGNNVYTVQPPASTYFPPDDPAPGHTALSTLLEDRPAEAKRDRDRDLEEKTAQLRRDAVRRLETLVAERETKLYRLPRPEPLPAATPATPLPVPTPSINLE